MSIKTLKVYLLFRLRKPWIVRIKFLPNHVPVAAGMTTEKTKNFGNSHYEPVKMKLLKNDPLVHKFTRAWPVLVRQPGSKSGKQYINMDYVYWR